MRKRSAILLRRGLKINVPNHRIVLQRGDWVLGKVLVYEIIVLFVVFVFVFAIVMLFFGFVLGQSLENTKRMLDDGSLGRSLGISVKANRHERTGFFGSCNASGSSRDSNGGKKNARKKEFHLGGYKDW